MSRASRSSVWYVILVVSIAGLNAGCAHLIENRAITAFANSLKAEDLERLKETTSEDFNKRALRTATALQDLKILNLPDGKTLIVEVEDLSKDKKRVTVQVGDTKKEVFYELARDESGKWVVDDIYLKQKKKGIEAYKSVTEQMDLLLTVRELLDAWSEGDRDQVLAVTTPKFKAALEGLPPSYLAHVTRHVIGKARSKEFKPSASLNEKVAYVRLPRSTGENNIKLELRKGKWQVADIAVVSKDEEEKLPSVLNLALAVNRCVGFLAAYQAEERTKLAELCTSDFFDGSLSFADLKQVKLPEPQLPEHELQARLRGSRADFTLRSESEFVQIDMQQLPATLPDAPPVYVVSDVTIYEIASKEEKRLSALFTAQGMLEVFIDALSHRQLEEIRHCSTQDFSTRVWSKLNDATVSSMPLEDFESKDIEYISASFHGALTKIDVRQGGHPFTYLLREEHGRFMVDDMHWQMTGAPASVKSTLEVLIPIADFASGITLGRDPKQQAPALELIRNNSSNDFNRMVWSQLKFVPNSGMSADRFLETQLRSMAISDTDVVVLMGDQQYGAKVTLRREYERYIVDDVMLIAGPDESQRLALKQILRTQLARNEIKPPQAIQEVILVSEADVQDRRVKQANYIVPDAAENKKYAPVNPPRELDLGESDPFAEEVITEQ